MPGYCYRDVPALIWLSFFICLRDPSQPSHVWSVATRNPGNRYIACIRGVMCMRALRSDGHLCMCQAAEGCAQAVTSSGRCLRWPSWTDCETSWAAGPLRSWLGLSPCPARKASSYYIAMSELPSREETRILEPAMRIELKLRKASCGSLPHCKPASSVPKTPSPLKGWMDMEFRGRTLQLKHQIRTTPLSDNTSQL